MPVYLPRVKRYLHDSRASLPPGVSAHTTRIVLGPGPWYGGKFSYYDWASDTVYLVVTDWRCRFAFYHELGHAFDRQVLTLEGRRRASLILGFPRKRWYWEDWDPMTHFTQPVMEDFADAYARASMSRLQEMKLRRFLVSRRRGWYNDNPWMAKARTPETA